MASATAVSPAKRWAQVSSSVLSCLLVGGVIFGFTALKPILLAEGVYADACPGKAPCTEQDVRINFIFTAAATATNVAALPVGATLDTFGPKKTSILGAILTIIGNLVFGWSSAPFDNYVVGFIMLSVAGPLVFLSCFHLSNSFPARSGIILAAITGAFDASSLPYTFYKEAYQRVTGGIRLETFFYSYTVIGVAILLQQLLIGQDEPYEDASANDSSDSASQQQSASTEPTADERSALLQQTRQRPSAQRPRPRAMRTQSSSVRRYYGPAKTDEDFGKEQSQTDPLAGMLYGKSASEQVFSSWFWILTLFLCITMVRVNFYIETTHEQLLYYTHDEQLSSRLVTAFIWLLPLGGLVAIPFTGMLLDKTSSSTAFLTIGALSTIFGMATLSSATWAQFVGIAVFVVLRPLFYTAISDFSAKCFGFTTFGRVYGLANTFSGIFNLIQWPMDLLVKYKLNGNFTPINLALVVAGIITCGAVSARIQTGVKQKAKQQRRVGESV